MAESMLEKMFDWQRKFGDMCFVKNNIKDNNGQILTFSKIIEEFNNNKFGPNDLPNTWLKKFHECMDKELQEISPLLPWKHWSKESIGEKEYPNLSPEARIEMLKIELVDIFHFFMSACMCVGMGPKDLFNLYVKKNMVNIKRQENEYNTAYKNEQDNIEIATRNQ